MEDLSHWDFAKDFSGEEAAALIVGLDLNSIGSGLFVASGSNPKGATAIPIYQRMKAEYDQSRGWYGHIFKPRDDDYYDGPRPARMLICLTMEWRDSGRNGQSSDEENDFYYWLQDDQRSGFKTQRFGVSEIARWLSASGLKSEYQFDGQQENSLNKSSGRWPWGNHHTDLLGHLEAAAVRFWQHYDPEEETYAPTNSDVSKWLVNEHKLSQKMADAIASMLRPDGLPTGPRK